MGVMEGNQRRGKLCREGLDDIGDWCEEKINILSRMALDRDEWKQRVKSALGTYRFVAHGS